MRKLLFGLGLTLLFALNLQAQEPIGNLRFFTDGAISCDNAPAICYELQLSAEPGEMLEFFGINVRMFFDDAVFTYHSIIPTLASDPIPGSYNYSAPSINPPVINNYGMVEPRYLQFNITGLTSTFLTKDITF